MSKKRRVVQFGGTILKWLKLETASGEFIVLTVGEASDAYKEMCDREFSDYQMAKTIKRESQGRMEFRGLNLETVRGGSILLTVDQVNEVRERLYVLLDPHGTDVPLTSSKLEPWPFPWIIIGDATAGTAQFTYKGQNITMNLYGDGV